MSDKPNNSIDVFKYHLRDEHRLKHGIDYTIMHKEGEAVVTVMAEVFDDVVNEHAPILVGKEGWAGKFMNRVKVINAESGRTTEHTWDKIRRKGMEKLFQKALPDVRAAAEKHGISVDLIDTEKGTFYYCPHVPMNWEPELSERSEICEEIT